MALRFDCKSDLMALLQLNVPSTWVICGPSLSGKTEFIYKVIKHSSCMFNAPFDKIYYFYGVWQKGFENIEENVDFMEGLPTQEFIDNTSSNQPILVVIDDQQQIALNSELIANLFTKYSHHKNITVLLVLQNLFHQGKFARDISLNTHYFVLFKNQRDINQVKILGNQLGLSNHLFKSYIEATKNPFSYLLIDLAPGSNNEFMLRSNIFPNEDPTIYINT